MSDPASAAVLLDPVPLARDLIRCPSVTPSEGGALDLLGSRLEGLGFALHRVAFSEDGTPDIDNLYARLGSTGPHLVFAGHTDVVPPGEPARWRHDPFSGTIENGELFGRGASDMKGAIAAFAGAVSRFVARRGHDFGGSISFLITGDEEGPSINGTVKLLDWCAQKGERFDAAIVGEPTNPDSLGEMVKIGRRGSFSGLVTVEGRQGHVAYPHRADNPIPHLLKLAGALIDPPLDAGSAHFQPSNLELTSLDVGNPTTNVIPATASLRFNVRFNDLWSVTGLEDEIRRRLAEADPAARWTLETVGRPSESFLTRDDSLIGTLNTAIQRVTGRLPELSTSGGTSDARFIKNFCPVVEFGLVGATMHQIDERVPVSDIERLAAIYDAFLDAYFPA